MVGRFHRERDYRTFFKAAKLLCSERKDITFVAVGEGPDLESFRMRLKSDGQSNIRILGVSKRVEEIVKTFSVGVLVSTNGEGISNVIMEYMALEKPVIATDAAGNREIVKDGENGFLIPFGDENTLALRIRKLSTALTLEAHSVVQDGRSWSSSSGLSKWCRSTLSCFGDWQARNSAPSFEVWLQAGASA